ncbi:hypothetical protein BS329_09735 [Amycolatopsis coloradensis]|uniref:Uncharacterized protein n=1 Tax=Amycolatopsis coloradensis TaxID=76021 RepID=A0A1R0KVY0_9PSEU|nr:hypothetical protein [Amycolatopsis coloradensis]OLZ53103.1 hypothetical protein BS329_09735 [Amycolatopsis coloradensis]
MFTDVFSAGPGSLPGYRAAGFPDPTTFGYATVRAKGLDPVSLAALDVLLSDVPFKTALETANATPVDNPDLYAAPVITTLSERVVSMLPAVGDDSLGRLATDWRQNPELINRDPTALHTWLQQVRKLCRDTVPAGNLLFVWNCL